MAVSGAASPVRAAEPKKFEGNILAPGANGASALAEEFACPDPGEPNGTNYAFVDLEGDYTYFKVSGPPYLWAPSTTPLQWGQYDFDMYIYDAKCKLIGEGATPAGVENTNTKKNGRFVLIVYFFGVQPNVPFTLEVANAPIKEPAFPSCALPVFAQVSQWPSLLRRPLVFLHPPRQARTRSSRRRLPHRRTTPDPSSLPAHARSPVTSTA